MKIVRLSAPTFRLMAALALGATLLMTGASFGQDQPAAQTPDNSAKNKTQATTADQQSEATSDRMITKKIRQAIIADKSLSMYGHNIKIITLNGSVTLKGPVHSEDEKQSIAAKAAEVVGSPDKVTNQITVKQ
ncbi:BON domain-containing protein [Acidisarcina polymorpha]|nr:BON domain-containing protein [Acidisarcina polymorpha]